MRSRSLAILACISLVGMTVLPGSAFPCCCKTAGSVASSDRSSSGSALAVTTHCHSEGHSRAKPAVAQHHGQAPSSKESIQTVSHRCRCVELWQIVALSGDKACAITVRDLPKAVTSDLTDVVCEPDEGGDFLKCLESCTIVINSPPSPLRC